MKSRKSKLAFLLYHETFSAYIQGIIKVIVYTENDINEIIRIISVRKASSYESKRYKENVKY